MLSIKRYSTNSNLLSLGVGGNWVSESMMYGKFKYLSYLSSTVLALYMCCSANSTRIGFIIPLSQLKTLRFSRLISAFINYNLNTFQIQTTLLDAAHTVMGGKKQNLCPHLRRMHATEGPITRRGRLNLDLGLRGGISEDVVFKLRPSGWVVII